MRPVKRGGGWVLIAECRAQMGEESYEYKLHGADEWEKGEKDE